MVGALAVSILGAKVLASKYHFDLNKPECLRKMADPRTKGGKCQMRLENLMPEIKKMSEEE